MRRVRLGGFLLLAVLLFSITGCAHVISPEMREKAQKGPMLPEVLKDVEAFRGEAVMWGGIVIETRNEKDKTTVKVLETPLDYYGAPGFEEQSRGRFLAEVPGYLEKEIYKTGKRITVAGEIAGAEVQPLDETEYTYPIVAVKELHLWTEPSYYPYYGPHPYDYWYWHGDPYPFYLPHFRYRLHFHHR